MTEASVTQIGQVPTRAFVYDGGKERTVRLTADLRYKFRDIIIDGGEGKIGKGEAARRAGIAVFGQTFWDKIPYDRMDEVDAFIAKVMTEIITGKETNEEEPEKGPSPEAVEAEPPGEEAPEPDPKNAEPPQTGG